MSDGTKSGCTKTGKKVMCINSNRRDLTYRKVYDVFTTQDGVYFIIDDVGDKRYENLEFPYWCENPDGMVDKANETKHKSKAGKKVKSICGGRADLTYNKVYDVFIDNKGDEFIIDDVGDSRYWSISDDDYYELVYDVANTVDTTNDINDNTKTKPKFKAGDKVKVVDTEQISQWTKDIEVEYVGVVVDVNVNVEDTPYKVRLDKCYYDWWFTDKCIELVGDDVNTVSVENTPNKKYNPLAVQQSGNHYKNGKIQPIEYSERNNLSMCQGNIVKYITRHKEKNGVDDLAKVVHYALLEALFVYGEDGATELRDKVDSLINIGNN